MKKRLLIAVAVILWLAAVTFPTVVITSNVDEVKTIDLSAIKARGIMMTASNLSELSVDFECSSPSIFMEKAYEAVMVGVTAEGATVHITYVGKSGNKWYRAYQDLPLLKFPQRMKTAELDQQKVVIYCSKSGAAIAISILSAVVLGILGFFSFPKRKKERLLN